MESRRVFFVAQVNIPVTLSGHAFIKVDRWLSDYPRLNLTQVARPNSTGIPSPGIPRRDLKKPSLKLTYLGGGFKYFVFSPLFGGNFLFDSYFSDALNPPTSLYTVPGNLTGIRTENRLNLQPE